MRKLKALINRVDNSGVLPRECAPFDVWSLRECYDALHGGKRYSTVSYAVASICGQCGLKVSEQGIGWRIAK